VTGPGWGRVSLPSKEGTDWTRKERRTLTRVGFPDWAIVQYCFLGIHVGRISEVFFTRNLFLPSADDLGEITAK